MKLIENEIYCRDLKKELENLDLSQLHHKTVLITGGLGMIGSAIADLLIIDENVEKVIIAARKEEAFNKMYGGVDKVDFLQYDALREIVIEDAPDYIIHCAGVSNPELYVEQPVETLLSNFRGIYDLLEYSKNNNVERVIYISSSEVYGSKDTDESFVEECYGKVNIDNIRSSYPVAKRSSEMLCRAYCKEYNVDVVVVRPGHIYGPAISNADKRVSSDFIKKAAEGENLELKSVGLQKRSYCYSVDCAAQILFALTKGEKGEAYNIGHDEITTIRRMAELCAVSGKIELKAVEPTSEDLEFFNPMNNSSLNNDKIKKLGYRDMFSVEEGIEHSISIIKSLN